MTKARSAKGRMVDFDLLKIRQKLQAKPVSLDVKAREDFIDKKLRRRMRKIKNATIGTIDATAGLTVTEPEHIDPKPVVVEQIVKPVVKPIPRTESKQKTRPRTK
jgi:hypothetical protein